MSAQAGHQEKLITGRRGIACIGVLVSLVLLVPRADAEHLVGHQEPAGPAAQHFPEFFHPPVDAEWGWELGGFAAGDRESDRSAIIFVHGNNTDHATWYPVLSLFTDLGWGSGDLWGLAYNGVGCTNDGPLYTRNTGYRGWTYQEDRSDSDGCVVTSNDVNMPDLAAFIDAVRRYTGSMKIHIVAHSLGVTLARKTLLEHDLYDAVDGFVAIAGANHGTSFCPPGSEDRVNSCDEIAAGTEWLEDLNAGPAGEGEAPGPTRWMTIYDGTGSADPAFAGPGYAQSPRLEDRAEYPEGRVVNCEYPGFYHNDLRVDSRIVHDYATFIARVERGLPFSCPDPPRPVPGASDRSVPDPPQSE